MRHEILKLLFTDILFGVCMFHTLGLAFGWLRLLAFSEEDDRAPINFTTFVIYRNR